jgi:hypothetical protein
VVVALGGSGAAIACDHGGGGADASRGVMAAKFAMTRHVGHHFGLLSLPSAYLGLSKDAIKAQLASGKTLAQIAAATPGKSAAGLVDYVLAAAKTKLDVWVANQKVTQAQEDAWLAKLRDRVTAGINTTWAFHH